MKRRRFETSPVGLLDAFSLLSDYLLRGGKRLRGALVLLGHQAGGGDGEGVLDVQRLKTGSYTFELPLLLGAILANAHAHVFDALSAYARPLGQAFQIADDLLGTFGSPEETGKSHASDLREGKRTLLV